MSAFTGCGRNATYSITWSAIASMLGEMLRPSALAVLSLKFGDENLSFSVGFGKPISVSTRRDDDSAPEMR
jgi:hypothetical protein